MGICVRPRQQNQGSVRCNTCHACDHWTYDAGTGYHGTLVNDKGRVLTGGYCAEARPIACCF